MKRIHIFGITGLLMALNVAVACEEKAPEAPPAEEVKEAPAPAKVEIPEYAPSGEFADVKKEAAAGIDDKNAMDRAKALDAKLDSALAELKPASAEGAAAAPQEAPAEASEGADAGKAAEVPADEAGDKSAK